jgi:signal transduction histidine kinase
MQNDVAPAEGEVGRLTLLDRLMDYLPRGNTLEEEAWQRRHRLLEWVLAFHVPGLLIFGLAVGKPVPTVVASALGPLVGLLAGHVVPHHRWASFFITGGLVYSSAALVVLSSGSIEAHFHFFIIIGFTALYQDWIPFLWNVVFTVVSHVVGTLWLGGAIFSHAAGQANPWLWSFIHGIAVLAACVGMVIFWRITEDEQTKKEELGRQLITADAELGKRRFTSEMLVNLARRNQSMLYRQLDIINQLEEKERDPDALSDLFTLDHLATRVRRNAESLLVLAGEQPPRVWSAPVALRDVVRAAIAETEDLDRVVFAVDDGIALTGHAVADLTHLLAELVENAVRFSPPDTAVTIRARPDRRTEGGYLLTVEDWGVGMPPADLADANELLASPHDVDLAVAQRLGFHVVSRLASRHEIEVSLSATPGSGVTAIVVLPAALFVDQPVPAAAPPPAAKPPAAPTVPAEPRQYVTEKASRSGLRIVPDVVREPQAPPTNGKAVDDKPVWVPPQTPAPFAEATATTESDWRGWWNPEPPAPAEEPRIPMHTLEREIGGDRSFVPSPVPRQRPSGEAEPKAEPQGKAKRDLRRRVPQAHLAPELRRPADDEAPAWAPEYDAAAASALSRYQASRSAAQAYVDGSMTGGDRG